MNHDDRSPSDSEQDETGGRSSSFLDEIGEPASEPAHRPWWRELLVLVAVALVLSVVVKTFFVQVFVIPSGSMEPGLQVGDRILVEKFSYWGHAPERGDVVVFEDPGGWLPGARQPSAPQQVLGALGLYPTDNHLVKRVIGTEGDTIVCCDDSGRLQVNGHPIDEKGYVEDDPEAACNGPMIGCTWTAGPVPDGKLFVMGDNRLHSGDSSIRVCRPGATDCDDRAAYVDRDLVVGKVWARVWPLERFGTLDPADAFGDVPDPDDPRPGE